MAKLSAPLAWPRCVFGRLWMAGTESDILAARNAAVAALEGIDGRD